MPLTNLQKRLKVTTFVEIGNTNVKTLGRSIRTTEFDIKALFDNNSFVLAGVVPSVLKRSVQELERANKEFTVIDVNSKFSFEHKLDGVGVDRLLCVEGALTLSRPPFCVISAGTAITVDFVSNRDGKAYFEGGVILPGFGLQIDTLNQKTAQLPKIDKKKPTSYFGTNTSDAINNGVCMSLVNGIEAIVRGTAIELGISFSKFFVTGGDAEFLTKTSFLEFQKVEDLIFKGMQSIYNKKGDIK